MRLVDQYMTVEEVAKALRVSTSTVRRAISANKLEVYRIGSRLRISEEQLQAYVGNHRSSVNGAEHLQVRSSDSAPRYETDQPSSYAGTLGNGTTWRVIHADAIAGLASLESCSVNCVVTSPPYYWQRDYEVDGQIGHEASVDEYVGAIREVFRETRRVLCDDGVVFLNIGDTYYSAKGKPHGRDSKHRARQLSRKKLRAVDGPGLGVPRKSLLGIPWRVALGLQEDGWVLRSSIIWQRPAPMPEPTAHDRPWRTFEPVFLFAKQPRYWYNRDAMGDEEDIWRISAHSRNPGSHFAPYPIEFADRCISAGCPEGGTVLDPFVGSGTTMVAALLRDKNAIGIELKKEYCDYIETRIVQQQDLLGVREGNGIAEIA